MRKILFSAPLVLFLLVGTASGGIFDFDNPGIEVSIGGFSEEAVGAYDPDYDFHWVSIGLFNKYYLNDNWSVNLCGDLGYLQWTHRHDKLGHTADYDVFSISVLAIVYRKITKNLSFGLGGGLGTLSQWNNLPEVGNSGFYGTITGRLNYKMSEHYGMELTSDHISATCYDDPGKNVLTAKIYYMF